MALNNIISRNFPGINVFNVSLIEETEPKEYHNRFFMFIKAIPSAKSDSSSTGRTYDNANAITFKVEAEKALALSFALKQYANGKGKAYDEGFDSFTIFADMSKSQYGSGDKKSMVVKMGQNQKTGKMNINVFFSQGDGNNKKNVALFLTPYESYSLGTIIEFLSLKCLEYELQGPGMVIKKQLSNGQTKPNTFKQTSPTFSQQNESYKSTQQDTQGVNKVTSGFGDMFSGSDNPFGD